MTNFFLQLYVHKFGNFSQSHYMKALLLVLAAIVLGVVYDLRNFKNLSTPEAMDNAQLARNVAEGKGYTTLFIRPFSLFLLKSGANSVTPAGLPDISNPPLYPTVLAGLMKAVKFDFTIPNGANKENPFWGGAKNFQRYQPDFLIMLFNQILLLLVVVLAVAWARKLFDSTVAWSSAALLLGSEMLWRFSISGLSTIFLMLMFMALIWSLTHLEIETREPKQKASGVIMWSAITGVLVAMGGLTRYSFAWLILPTLLFVFFAAGPGRARCCLILLAAFGAVMFPWLIRNYHLCGAPFGTAGYSPLADTALFPGYRLERSVDPSLGTIPGLFWLKFSGNLHAIREKLLGTRWVTAFFVAGLLIGFHNITLQRLRYFVLASFVLLVLVEAFGGSRITDDSPGINSENLLILLLPVMLIYATSFFCLLLDQLKVPPQLFGLVSGMFLAVACLPLILGILKSETTLAYPPYYPPLIQQTASWMKPDELMASDIPWAVAWYGERQCLWLPLNALPDPANPDDPENLLSVDTRFKTVNAVYLSQLTTDVRLFSGILDTRKNSWARLAMGCLNDEVPREFPLREMPPNFLPGQLFLSGSQRWPTNVIAHEPPPPEVYNPTIQNPPNDFLMQLRRPANSSFFPYRP